jgi:hypothetical protein
MAMISNNMGGLAGMPGRMVTNNVGGITGMSGGGMVSNNAGALASLPPQPPNWLGSPAAGMPEGFYNINPDLFPFYQMRNQYNRQHGVYAPGSPNFTTWDAPNNQMMIGVRNAGTPLFQANATSSPFGQAMLQRASAGGNFAPAPLSPGMTARQYNQAMAEIARNAAAAQSPMIAYYNPQYSVPGVISNNAGGLLGYRG